jgi:hypothetical protein
MTEAVPWTCPVCRESVPTPFCPRCGEEPLAPRDLTLRGLAERVFHALTSIDGRAVRTVWRLFRFPGDLTVAWSIGIRKAYVSPIELFLIANVLFFAIQSFTGEIVFSSPLDSHLHHQDWSNLARSLVAQRLETVHLSLQDYATVFDRAVALNAKSLVVLMTIPFALLLPLVFIRQHQPLMKHVTFAIHQYTFLLLFFCIALLVAKLSALLGHGGLELSRIDKIISIANLAVCAWYLYVAIGRVYEVGGLSRYLQAALLSMAIATIVVGYRFVLFIVTLYFN